MSSNNIQKSIGEWIERPRLNVLFSQGVVHPLIMVVAGTGYGKTCAVTQFTNKVDARTIWFRANNINNYTERFWRTLKQAIGEVLPMLAPRIKKLSFPRTYQQQDYFLRLFADAIYTGKQVLFVLDDLQNIKSDEIKQFLTTMLEVNLENFCMIAISNAKPHVYFQPGMLQALPFRVTEDDLRYTDAELAARLAASGIPTGEAVIAAAKKSTDGWPLAVHVLAEHWQNHKNYLAQVPFSIDQFMHMFYSSHFTGYSPEVRLMLIKLAHLPMFTLEIISAIGGCDLHEAAEVIRLNPFVHTDNANATHTYQIVYKQFLKSCFLIEKDELHRIHLLSAKQYQTRGFVMEAIQSFLAAGAYDDASTIMCSYSYEKLDHDTATFFCESINAFPEGYLETHPLTQVYLSLLYMHFGRQQEAQDLLHDLLNQYRGVPEVEGEASLSLGEIIIQTDVDAAMPYYHRACACLPAGSTLRSPNAFYLINQSLIKLYDSSPDSLSKNLAHMKSIAECAASLYQRSTEGWYHLTFAEAAYYQLDMDKARESSFKAVYAAAVHGQYDIQCNAWFLLMRIEVMHGNLPGAMDYLGKINTLIHKEELDSLFILYDCVSAWLHLRIHDFSSVPRWLTEVLSDEITKLYPTSERDIILRVLYKVEIGKYAEALAMVDAFIPYCETRLFWTVRLYLYIAKAIIHVRMKKPDKALAAFKEAYQLTYNNHIVAPFIETGHYMRSLIDTIRKIDGHGLDIAWLQMIHAKASSYAKRAGSMLREHLKAKSTTPESRKFTLSIREIEVLEYLSKGLKYDEISDFMDISINGVKKHVTSIYSKMGAVNRADAIYIAMTEGIIK